MYEKSGLEAGFKFVLDLYHNISFAIPGRSRQESSPKESCILLRETMRSGCLVERRFYVPGSSLSHTFCVSSW